VENARRPPRLLFVEDDVDIRETLADLLRDEGYEVSETSSARGGLQQLEQQRFDVLLSDYRLPDQHGTEMIADAAKRGDLADTAILILSASTNIEGAQGLRVLQKPIDFDVLCRELEAALETRSQPAVVPDPGLRLALFVMQPSPTAERALATLTRMLERRHLPASCLEVIDVSTPEGSARALQERVAFTPTLLRLSPLPRRWIVGDLRRKGVVERLLHESGAQ
jgi:CheY-like chemotaxis protein